MAEKVFADGIRFEAPREGAPDFVKGRLSFKVSDAVTFLQAHENNAGYVDCDVKESQGGKLYVELNSYVKGESPVQATETKQDGDEEVDVDAIPF